MPKASLGGALSSIFYKVLYIWLSELLIYITVVLDKTWRDDNPKKLPLHRVWFTPAYLEQEETARELEGLANVNQKQLPLLAHNTRCKATAYVLIHEGITDERVDELLSDFLVLSCSANWVWSTASSGAPVVNTCWAWWKESMTLIHSITAL